MQITGTSSSSTSGSSTDYNRITGMVSGLDTDGLVKTELAPYQAKIDQQKQSEQYEEWQQAAYVDVITSLKDFGNNFDILQSGNMVSSSAYTGTTASTTLAATGVDGSNYLTASTYPGAVQGNYQVQINNLAAGATSQSALNSIPYSNSISFTPSSSDLTYLSGQQISFNVGTSTTPSTITLGSYSSSSTINDVVNDINNNLPTSLQGLVKATTSNGQIVLTSTSSTSVTLASSTNVSDLSSSIGRTISNSVTSSTPLSQLGIANGDTLSFAVTGQDGTTHNFSFTLSSTDKVSDLINKLNSTTVNGDSLSSYVNVNFSELTDKLSFKTISTGSANTLVVSGTGSDKLGTSGTFKGQDANISILAPGETTATQVTKSSNSFTIDNITYNLNMATAGQTVNLNVKADASAQVTQFQKFVDSYNTLVDKLNSLVNEKKDYDYKPLTDAQKSQMTTDQITQWETKAKQGILGNDSYLTNVLTNLRQAVYDTVQGAGISITSIGISTTSNFMDGGKLQIDTTKLKTALEQNGSQVQKLFTQNLNSTTSSYNNNGIFQRFKNILDGVVGSDGSLVQKAGYINTRWVTNNDLSKDIADRKQKITDLTTQMNQKQQSLYSMWATFESNMSALNSQSSWLSSALSG